MATNKKSKELSIEIKLHENVGAQLEGNTLALKGPKGDLKKEFRDNNIKITTKNGSITLKARKWSKVNKKHIKSYAAHIRNMIRGCAEAHKYTLKICSGHFPMNVSIGNSQLIVKNFLGEKVPRTLRLKLGAAVRVEGDLIVVESASKEIAGQVSADIEQLTRRTGYDPRIFQDGIWIVEKDGKGIG